MYRVVTSDFKIHAFDDYRQAKEFKQKNGGQLYERVYPR